MNKTELRSKIAKQQLALRASYEKVKILQECFSQQLNFIQSDSKRKALCCNRRSGKSFTIALYMIDQALKTPRGKFLYIGLTNESAKGAMWTDIFETVILKYRLQSMVNFKETALEIKFNNGSTIFLRGMDATPKQMNRVRGQKYTLVAIDEAQDFTQDLNQIINGVLDMTLAQNSQSVLCICGTPGKHLGEHYWWKINKPNTSETEWQKFEWSWEDNISSDSKTGERVCDNIKLHWEKKIAQNPLITNTPEYKREVLGQWVLDADVLVYRFSDSANVFDPSMVADFFYKAPSRILALDLGYYDATAFVVGAYNKRYDGILRILESHKKSGMTITDVANEVRRLDMIHHFAYIVVDAANSQAVEEMKQVHNLPLIPADKMGKEAHIALLNSDLITCNVLIDPNKNRDLIKELSTLMWDQKALRSVTVNQDGETINKGRHREDARFDNHLTDALLYCHHFSRHYWYSPDKHPFYEPGSDQDLSEKLLKHVMGKQNNVKHLRNSYLDSFFENVWDK